jgi:hypothetical protein
MDPVVALEDFKKRVANYEKAYEPIGDYEEEIENIQYCKVMAPSIVSLTSDDQCWKETRGTQHSRIHCRPSYILPSQL